MTAPFRWTDLSADPNAPVVVRKRQEVLDAARRAPIKDRDTHLRSLAAGKRVLDVGVVEHFIENQQRERWLHRQLVDVAASCRGVDILDDEVSRLKEMGYDVVAHDLTLAPLDEQFDLVVMGEIIEHLGAPEPFLANVRSMVRPGGRLVVTTPNPYMLNRAVHSMRGCFPDSVDHAVLLGPGNIIELAARTGFVLDAWRGVQLKDLPGWKNRIVSMVRRGTARVGFSPDLGCDTLIYELVPGND